MLDGTIHKCPKCGSDDVEIYQTYKDQNHKETVFYDKAKECRIRIKCENCEYNITKKQSLLKYDEFELKFPCFMVSRKRKFPTMLAELIKEWNGEKENA